MQKYRRLIFTLLIAACCMGSAVSAQSKRSQPAPVKKQAVETVSIPEPTIAPTPEPVQRGKKNERPGAGASVTDGRKPEAGKPENAVTPVYFYEFTHPYYLVRKLIIEHDESGKGKIAFVKGSSTEMISDPLEVSPAAMERIRSAYAALNFLDSKENYQYEKDYPHLGVMKISMRKDGRERTSEFNWTENKDARAVTDEYRKLGNQYIWMFDINLSRENQPLQAPGLMDELDSMIRRKDVSDAQQLIPFLQKLSQDEHIPLIARNHASRIIATIEKQISKEKN